VSAGINSMPFSREGGRAVSALKGDASGPSTWIDSIKGGSRGYWSVPQPEAWLTAP
jgi:hypothetical protein